MTIPEQALSSVGRSSPDTRRKSWTRSYFFGASLVILAFALIGFSDNLFTDVGQPSNRQPKFIIHGLFCFGWILVLVTQTHLIRTRQVATHRRLGVLAALVAAGVVASTWYIQFVPWVAWGERAPLARTNVLFMMSFGLAVVLGFWNRRRPSLHKRFLFLATLYMLGPIVDRVGGNTGISPYITNPVLWNGMFLSFFTYDWAATRRIHPILYLGYAWFWAVWFISFR